MTGQILLWALLWSVSAVALCGIVADATRQWRRNRTIRRRLRAIRRGRR